MFLRKFWKFLRKFNKNLERFNEIFLISILIAGWGVNWSPSFANFPGFGGGGNVPPVPFPLEPLMIFLDEFWLEIFDFGTFVK